MIRRPLETSIKVAPEFWKELPDCSGMLSSTKLYQQWPQLGVCCSVSGKITKVKQAQNLRDFQMMVLACLLGLTVIIRVTVSLSSRALRAVRNPSNFTFSWFDTQQSNLDRKKRKNRCKMLLNPTYLLSCFFDQLYFSYPSDLSAISKPRLVVSVQNHVEYRNWIRRFF